MERVHERAEGEGEEVKPQRSRPPNRGAATEDAMKDCSKMREFAKSDEDKAERPKQAVELDRVAEQAARYTPHASWENEINSLYELLEGCRRG